MSDSITLLKAETPSLRKVFTEMSGEKGNISVPTFYTPKSVTVDSLSSLVELLTVIGNDPSVAIIRGEQTDETAPLRRRASNFAPASRSWCMVDIDSLECPDDINDTEGYLKTAIASLPQEFQKVNFFYHFSSSMGIKAGIRVHLWFWLERPCSDEEMKAWLADYPVDRGLFNPVQLHLTCSPTFEDGRKDPVEVRDGLYKIEGYADAVTPPDDLEVRAKTAKRIGTARRASANGTYYSTEIVFDDESGLAIDGREQLMFQLSNECMVDLLKVEGDVCENILGEAIWERFTELADLTIEGGYVWTIDIAKAKARDRIAQWKSGAFTYKSRNDLTTLLPAQVDKEWPSLVSAQEAEIELNSVLDSLFEGVRAGQSLHSAVRITMGAGKTTRTIEKLKTYLASTFGELIEVYVPRHDLANEWERQLVGIENTDVVHVLPRTGGREVSGQREHKLMCARADYVRSLELSGYPIYRNACLNTDAGERCSHFDGCEYLAQFRSDASPSNTVRIYTHQSLFLPKNEVEDQVHPSLMIVDESFVSAAVGNLPELTSDQVVVAFRTPDKPDIGSWIVECLRTHHGRLRYLIEVKDLTVTDLETIPLVGSSYETDFDREAAAVLPDNQINQSLLALRELLIEELKRSDLEVLQRISWHHRKERVVLSVSRPNRFRKDVPTLYLDATLDETITSTYIPNAEIFRIDVAQRAVVTQVHDRAGSNSFWNDLALSEQKNLEAIEYQSDANDLSKLVQVLNTWVDAGEKPLLVAHKMLADFLKLHPKLNSHVQLAHFQSLRGSNDYKDCTVIFITGRNQPAQEDVVVQARGIFGSDIMPFTEESFDTEGFQLAQYWPSGNYAGEPAAISVRSFGDERISNYQSQLRESETVQAIARLRLVYSDYKKRVFLLSNLPMEMPVDKLVTFDSLLPNKLEHCLLNEGHVALSVQGYVKQFSSEAVSDNNAKKILTRHGADKPEQLLRFLPALVRSTVLLATYKAGDKRKTKQAHLFLPMDYKGDHLDATFTPPTHEEVLATLQQLWGEDSEIVHLQLTPLMHCGGGLK